ncbi:hypothetical protein BBD40_07965 [Paenibacillus ihbetae]|uniref:HTH araC/xylS-type domain-containing protein n=2 Tax=Paenibacillus ihbetae TaxID=1870820 RepID=A0ABX3JVV0_9BACL|nr:hypothetical protein BBD40_07965 [Paenibacillus ihbetae]
MRMQIILPRVEIHRFYSSFENTAHTHEDQFQITIPIKGTCHFQHEHKYLSLPPGEGIVLMPRDQHSLHIGDGASLVIIRVRQESMYPQGLPSQREPQYRQQFDVKRISRYFGQWTSGMMNRDLDDPLEEEELETRMISDLQELIWSGGLPVSPAMQISHEEHNQHHARVLEYIHANYTEQLNISTLAGLAMQSRYHFIRTFKSLMGVTPYQYVLQLRVREAIRQLQQSDATVTDISFNLGFSSPSQLYRAFAKITGMTPEQYRKTRL